MFMYQGFNPELVLKHLSKYKTDNKISPDEFKSDMKSLIAAGTIMGNVTDKNLAKIKLEGKAKLNALYNKYKLKKGGVGTDRTAVNMPRLMSTFPIIASKCMINPNVSPKEFGNEMRSHLLDKCFKTPVFPALIPRTLPREIIQVFLILSTCYTTEQSLAIGKDKSVEVVFKKQFGYAKVAFGSSIPVEEDRLAHFKSLKFTLENMRSCYKHACNVTKIEARFPDHESWFKHELLIE